MGSGQQDLLRNTSKGESYIDCVAVRFLSRISFMEVVGSRSKSVVFFFCFFFCFVQKERRASFLS